ncbi:hypothetical protein EG347_20960 [Chryseobacterium sp. G0186]|uniref:hypothetical protein n=1 Tax=Chryseobacterium sp. G0186 TaxID=2487064 RepID=UPI000F4FFD5A|nr:hypothetical protein [Chryseobacterium sp. G0186]AZA79778.1 hypothetical protein EG347_20960 [Chryseobacterium sp. G0186]
MDYPFYLKEFRSAISKVSNEELEICGLKIAIDIVLESVALKVYKPEWSSDLQSPLHAKGRIFFSIWISDETIRQGKMYYNIHALKLRELKDYSLSSRNFAQDFRSEFLKYQKDWPNVRVNFGPLTLMQGWVDLKAEDLQENIAELVQKFLKISSMIDIALAPYKKSKI